MKIIWSPLSLERIVEIAEYIAEDKPGASEKWLDSIFESVKRLKKLPESGRKVPEVNQPDIREILYGHYRIIYRIVEMEISILTIRHGKQLQSKEEL